MQVVRYPASQEIVERRYPRPGTWRSTRLVTGAPDPLTLYRVHPTNRSRDIGIHVDRGHRILERLFSDPSLPGEVLHRPETLEPEFVAAIRGLQATSEDAHG